METKEAVTTPYIYPEATDGEYKWINLYRTKSGYIVPGAVHDLEEHASLGGRIDGLLFIGTFRIGPIPSQEGK